MSLTAFQRFRRLHQVEEMKPENIKKEVEVKSAPVIEKAPEVDNFVGEPLVPEVVEEPIVQETKTANRRSKRK